MQTDDERRFLALENSYTADDLRRLEVNLRGVLGGELEGREHLNLLNVACGRGDETGILAKLLREKAKSAHVHGLDIRASEIGQAQGLWGKELPGIVGAEGVTADFQVHRGDQLAEMRELELADMVFIRHQNFWNGGETWRRLFDQALDQMKDDGVFVMTSYFDREHAAAKKALEELGVKQVGELSDGGSRALFDAPEKSVDRHIAVFKKG